jgi:hypothetical protein
MVQGHSRPYITSNTENARAWRWDMVETVLRVVDAIVLLLTLQGW